MSDDLPEAYVPSRRRPLWHYFRFAHKRDAFLMMGEAGVPVGRPSEDVRDILDREPPGAVGSILRYSVTGEIAKVYHWCGDAGCWQRMRPEEFSPEAPE